MEKGVPLERPEPRCRALGQACRKAAARAGSLDLLIAAVALHHDAEIQTFDADFHGIAAACGVQVKVLQRPVP